MLFVAMLAGQPSVWVQYIVLSDLGALSVWIWSVFPTMGLPIQISFREADDCFHKTCRNLIFFLDILLSDLFEMFKGD